MRVLRDTTALLACRTVCRLRISAPSLIPVMETILFLYVVFLDSIRTNVAKCLVRRALRVTIAASTLHSLYHKTLPCLVLLDTTARQANIFRPLVPVERMLQ